MIERIKQLSFIGFSALIAGFLLSIIVLIVLLFNYDKIKKEGDLVLESYNTLLKLKESSEKLLTTNNLENEAARWKDRVTAANLALERINTLESRVIAEESEETGRIWRIVQKEAKNVDTLLQNPLLDNRHTIDKPVLRRLGENYRRDKTNDFFVALYDLTNHVTYMTQYENFLLDHFVAMRQQYNQNEQQRLDNLKVLIILLPALIMLFSILFSLYVSRWINKIESRLLSTQESLRDSLKKFTYLFNTTMESILILQDDTCIDVNEECLRMFGFQSKEEAVGRSAFDFVAEGRDRALAKEKITEEANTPYEVTALRPDGTTFPALIKGHNFRTSEGAVRIAAIMDLTELKASEAALKELNENLQQEVVQQLSQLRQKDDMLLQQSKLAAMGDMISNIAHQWRQPLNALALNIQDVSEAFQFNELNEAYLKHFNEQSMKQINSMSQTINDFRNFFSSDKEAVQFNPSAEITKVTDIVKAQLHNHGIEIRAVGNDFMLTGLPNEYKQVVLNLVTNARDAIMEKQKTSEWFPGKIMITLSEADDIVRTEVRDNGGGIPTDIMDRIFEPYFSTKFQSQGIGLGLYMAKNIIEKQMQGTLHAQNSGEGAVFVIELPTSPAFST